MRPFLISTVAIRFIPPGSEPEPSDRRPGFLFQHPDGAPKRLGGRLQFFIAMDRRGPATESRREIDAIDQQIDALVYELYGLAEKEIRIVEEATT